jgi:hypothetical protein
MGKENTFGALCNHVHTSNNRGSSKCKLTGTARRNKVDRGKVKEGGKKKDKSGVAFGQGVQGGRTKVAKCELTI